MAINPKPLDRELTQEEQFVCNAFFEAKRDAAKAALCFDLSPWVFRHDNRLVCLLKCSEGPVGEMILVKSLHEATQLFGKDLFDQTKDHFDPVTKACYQILLNEPCYIVRIFRPKMVSFQTEKELNTPTICDCIHTVNSPEFIRAKNEEYRKNYEKALAECEQDRPESFKSWSEERISKILRSYEGWDKFTREERSWLKRRLEVELLKSLRYVGQLPPCCQAPIIVDQDFQYLYRELRIDPDLVKRVAKGKLEK